MVNGLVADDEGQHFHGETSRPSCSWARGCKTNSEKNVLRTKLTELHSWNMAVETRETSTTTTPMVETEQLETVVSSFSPPACPEYQTTSMASKTNCSGNQSHLSTKRTGRQNAWVEVLSCSPTVKESRKHPGKTTRPETQMI